jgi:signal transduction histidine kinase
MTPAQQKAAFDAVQRADQARSGGRAGIGLPLARQLAEAHGGTLTLLSEPGQGTMVTIELPRG